MPAAAVTDMYASGVPARITEVTDEQLASINAIANSRFRFDIKAETYPRQPKAVATIAQPNILVALSRLDESWCTT